MLVLLVACGQRPTELRFDVTSDRMLSYVEYLTVTVEETSTGTMLDMRRIPVGATQWSRSFALVPTVDPDRRVHVTIEANDGSGTIVAVQQVSVRFVPGQLVVVPVELSMMCSVPFAGARCGEDHTCLDGECAPLGTEPGLCAFGTAPNCDVVVQDCPADQGCYPVADAAGVVRTQCSRAGLALLGGHCMYANDCAPGLVCLVSNTCARLCCPDAVDSCRQDEACIVPSADHPGICVHQDPCSLLPNAACAGGEMCIPISRTVNQCVARGTSGDGAACVDTSQCLPDYLCVTPSSSGSPVCRPLCRMSAGSCAAPHTCAGVADILPSDVGVCVP